MSKYSKLDRLCQELIATGFERCLYEKPRCQDSNSDWFCGEYRRAATWQVVSPEKADSHQISFKCESGESSLIRQRMGKSEDTPNNVYKSGGKVDSQDSHLALKGCESGPGELPNCPACGRNEWAYSPDGELLCPCGKSSKKLS